MDRIEELVVEVIEGEARGENAYGIAEAVLERLRSEGLLREGRLGDRVRAIEEAEEARVGVRMICLEDDEDGRVCYLELGHDGAHGFEAVPDAG